MIRVGIVDDQPLVREGFHAVLRHVADVEAAWAAADGVDAVSMAADDPPDVILMDVRMPRMDGIEATRRILAAGTSTRVIILTTFDLDEYVYEALLAGGRLDAGPSPDGLGWRVRAVMPARNAGATGAGHPR